MRFVIIEDEEAHFDLMKRAILRNLPDSSVHYFQEAGACLEKLDQLGPDIIITDYLMPGMNGIEFLEALKREKSDIPVIMITGQGDENIAVQAMKLGAWDYIVKSVDFFTLLPAVVQKVMAERTLKEYLRASERRFQDLAEGTSEWIWEIDSKGTCIYSNSVSKDILGYGAEEIIGTYFYDFLFGESREDTRKGTFEIMAERKSISAVEHCLIHRDGHRVIVETNGVPFFDKAGNLLGYRGIHRDISERKLAETALRESEEKFRRIFSESPIGIVLFNAAGQLIDINKSALDIFGISNVSEVRGFQLFEDPNLSDETKAKLRKGEALKFEGEFDFERVKERNLLKTNKSGIIHIDVLVTQLGLRDEEPFSGYLLQIHDITERKQAEEHVHRLTQQLIKAQEIEWQRLSRDLHDHLAQDLSTLKINLDTLFNSDSTIPMEKREKISDLSQTVHKAITVVRDMAYGLHPASLDQLGLVQTVLQHCEEFSSRKGMEIDFISAGMEDIRLDFDTEITLFRLIQEGLNNINKHANASHVTIRLVASFPKIILRIEDDGKGFDVEKRLEEALAERRMGIRSMEERVALLNGKMRIKSNPTRGTKILVEVPYNENMHKAS